LAAGTHPANVSDAQRGRMTAPSHSIRLATPDDAPAVHAIYAPFVRDTAISFEYEVPAVEEIRARMERVLADGFPWLVAESESTVDGYAYASAFRTRKAYQWSVETSIYIHPQRHRRGLGRALYGRLLELLELQGYRSAYGGATAPNPASEGLHRSMGFERVGYQPRVGYKLGAWHDVVWWRKALGPEGEPPGQILTVAQVLSGTRSVGDGTRGAGR
jgi:L-amino acid N-acyltransferase YncA